MKKLIISAALCGAGTKREQTPYLPITPDEIAKDVVEVVKAGASIVHIHARDENGKNTMETELFVRVVEKAREAVNKAGVDVIFNLTTSGSGFSEDLRLAHLPILKPEMCSYDPGSMNFANSYVFINSPQFLERLGEMAQQFNIKPELEIFDAGMIGNVNYYYDRGFLKDPLHYQFVLGAPGGMPGNIESLAYLLPKIKPGSTWSITGLGKAYMPMILAGLAEGCHGLRVGLEDNIYLDRGVLATNAQLVDRAVRLANLAGREIATADETRKLLKIT